jgi:hypothetical protein
MASLTGTVIILPVRVCPRLIILEPAQAMYNNVHIQIIPKRTKPILIFNLLPRVTLTSHARERLRWGRRHRCFV